MEPRAFLKWTVFMLAAVSSAFAARPQQQSAAPDAAQVQANEALVKRYCATCHNEKLKTGGLTLENLDLSNVSAHAETLEKVIRKLGTGSMPPQGMPRPDKATLDGFATWLEASLDRSASTKPNPGHATLHRLNRTEYGNAVKDILGLEIDEAALLPSDD